MKIEYLGHLGNDLMVANAARVSMNKWKTEFDDKDDKLIKYLATNKHISPFFHPQIQVRAKIPIFIARQLLRHTVGIAVNEVSRRYVDEPSEFFVPSEWRERAENVKQGSGGKHPDSLELSDDYEAYLADIQAFYQTLIGDGVAPEQARMILPQSMYTTMILTGSLYWYARVYTLRSDGHAQKEIQEVAHMIDKIILPLFPVSWNALKEKHR